MDYGITPEQEGLRREFDASFREEMRSAPSGWRGGINEPFHSDENWAFHLNMARKLAKKGWLVRTWPKAYGGQDAPFIEQALFNESQGYRKAPGVDIFAFMIGPALLVYGNSRQRDVHLPRIANGEVQWCQGWSEPNAGSDVAAVNLKAVRDGDNYVLNGQKTWTSNAHKADWMFTLVRTGTKEEKHKGLSVLLVDMNTPGITVRPIRLINGLHSFNEVFFDDVRVPVDERVGDEGKGWEIVRAIMDYERISGVADLGLLERGFEELVDFCRKPFYNAEPLINNAIVGQSLAQMFVDIKVAQGLVYRLCWLMDREKGTLVMTSFASALKIICSELMIKFSHLGSEIMGLYGQLRHCSPRAPLGGFFEEEFLFAPAHNIYGGTSEIQRNIIAWTALGLPRH